VVGRVRAEDEVAVRPEAEHHAQADADHGGGVEPEPVGGLGEAEAVLRPGHDRRLDEGTGEIEADEQQRLAADLRLLPGPVGPVPVRHIGESRGDRIRDDRGLHRADRHRQVEDDEVQHRVRGADQGEGGDLGYE
jgi:hypothetical protein